MAQSPTQTETFAQIFVKPSVEAMLALTPTGFEHFVEYVFQRAGFIVQFVAQNHNGSGVDLELYSQLNGISVLYAIVQVKKHTDDVPSSDVNELLGSMRNHPGAQGYLVTTAGFTPAAQQLVVGHHDVVLLPGNHLIRFINYVRSSRSDGDASVTISPECVRDADSLERRDSQKTRIIAIANNKGGIGKTTTAINMAQVLDSMGQRVLLVDLDSQGNLSYRMPQNPQVVSNPRYLGNYLKHQCALAQTIRQTQYKNVWIIAADPDLRIIDPGANGFTTSILNFARDLHAPEISPLRHQTLDEFDWIILDTPTASEFRIRLALGACDYVLIPTQVETFAITGVALLADTALAIHALMGRGTEIAGAIVTDYHGRGDPSGARAIALRNGLAFSNISIFNTTVHHHDGIDLAHLNQINLYGGKAKQGKNVAAREYREFVEEFIKYVNRNN
jgi:chromosome partitioning protein